jgi:site-specific recombinase XerD
MLINEAMEEYLEWKLSHSSEATYDVYRRCMRRFCEFFGGGEEDITNIKITRVTEWQNSIRKKMAPQYVCLHLIILKDFFGYWAKQGRKIFDPAIIRIPKARANSHQAISKEEYDRMLLYFRGRYDYISLRDELIIRLLWDTGCRVSELCSIDLDDIDIQAQYTFIENRKNKRMRRVFWSDETADVMKKYVGIRICLSQTQSLLTGAMATSRITTRTVQRVIKSIAEKSGIKKKITPHSFRHGWARYRRDQGAQLPFIQKALGHINPASTFVYEQYSDPEMTQLAQSFFALQKRESVSK